MKISGIIVARNEERMISDAIKSLDWCDEIIVVDNNSSDKTAAIAKKAGAKVFEYKKVANEGNFAELRNFAFGKASGYWIIYLDADERVTKELEEEILNKLPDTNLNAYVIPRRNFIFGKEFKHSGQYPDYQKRLLRKSAFKKWVGNVHEEPVFSGELGFLENAMQHFKNMTIREMVEKTNKWSEIEAKLMYEAKHPPMNVFRFMTAMVREFWRRMILEMAFLDGAEGIIYAIYQVFSKFTSYAKLYEIQIRKKYG